METIDISEHQPALCQLARRHRMSVGATIKQILVHGIDREYEVFDWSPAPLREAETVTTPASEASANPGERRSA